MEDIAAAVEYLRPSWNPATPPLVQCSRSRPACPAPLRDTPGYSFPCPAEYSESIRDFVTRGRIMRYPPAPGIEYPLCIDSVASPPSSFQSCYPLSFHTSYSPSPIPFPSGRSPPLVPISDSVSDMSFSIFQPRDSIPFSVFGMLDSFIILVSARVSISDQKSVV